MVKLCSSKSPIIYFITTHIPSLLEPTRSIFPFFCKLTKERSIVLFVTPTSLAISSAVLFGVSINNPRTAFSVLFKPTFKPTFFILKMSQNNKPARSTSITRAIVSVIDIPGRVRFVLIKALKAKCHFIRVLPLPQLRHLCDSLTAPSHRKRAHSGR